MSPSEKFRQFAGECRAMAKFARSPESKAIWDGLAARWVQCAELNELRSSTATLDRMARRRKAPGRVGQFLDLPVPSEAPTGH
jgi:hypothetical protein